MSGVPEPIFNFGLNIEQQELRGSLRRFLDDQCSIPAIRRIVDEPDRFASAIWRGLAEQGLLGIAIAEAQGGSGLGCTDLAVVAELLGRAPLPLPYLETITAASLIGEAGNADQQARYLPRIAAGECVATLAIDEPTGFWDAQAIQASAEFVDGRYRLTGNKLWVPYAHVADLIVCAVRTTPGDDADQGISLFAIESPQSGLQARLLEGMDDTFALCELNLDGLSLEAGALIGPRDRGWEIWCQARQQACVLASAELIGTMERALEMIVAYSKERSQFGKLIGSYQALKHRCADMLTELEAVRGSVWCAAWAQQHRMPDAEIAVSSAKAYASDAAVRATETSLQSFGAIGFTWEHDIHFYLKRARRLQMAFGDAVHHRERIAALWL